MEWAQINRQIGRSVEEGGVDGWMNECAWSQTDRWVQMGWREVYEDERTCDYACMWAYMGMQRCGTGWRDKHTSSCCLAVYVDGEMGGQMGEWVNGRKDRRTSEWQKCWADGWLFK